ncbi:MAG: hypothetical protein HQL50_08050 [Magnetococcales bacterium]|nr:hypothetical protein [Magnetococcales bacterium]
MSATAGGAVDATAEQAAALAKRASGVVAGIKENLEINTARICREDLKKLDQATYDFMVAAKHGHADAKPAVDEARKLMAEASELYQLPATAHDLLRKGQLALEKGDRGEAIAYLRGIVDLTGGRAPAFVNQLLAETLIARCREMLEEISQIPQDRLGELDVGELGMLYSRSNWILDDLREVEARYPKQKGLSELRTKAKGYLDAVEPLAKERKVPLQMRGASRKKLAMTEMESKRSDQRGLFFKGIAVVLLLLVTGVVVATVDLGSGTLLSRLTGESEHGETADGKSTSNKKQPKQISMGQTVPGAPPPGVGKLQSPGTVDQQRAQQLQAAQKAGQLAGKMMAGKGPGVSGVPGGAGDLQIPPARDGISMQEAVQRSQKLLGGQMSGQSQAAQAMQTVQQGIDSGSISAHVQPGSEPPASIQPHSSPSQQSGGYSSVDAPPAVTEKMPSHAGRSKNASHSPKVAQEDSGLQAVGAAHPSATSPSHSQRRWNLFHGKPVSVTLENGKIYYGALKSEDATSLVLEGPQSRYGTTNRTLPLDAIQSVEEVEPVRLYMHRLVRITVEGGKVQRGKLKRIDPEKLHFVRRLHSGDMKFSVDREKITSMELTR